MVLKPTRILLINVNTSAYADNGGQNLQTLLRFIRDLHPSDEHHHRSWSPGTHVECKTSSQTPNWRNTTLLGCTNKLGAEENRDDENRAPCPALRTSAPGLGPQRRKGRQATTSGHTDLEKSNQQLTRIDENATGWYRES